MYSKTIENPDETSPRIMWALKRVSYSRGSTENPRRKSPSPVVPGISDLGFPYLMTPSKVAGHTRFLLHSFHDSDVDSIALQLSQLEKVVSLLFKHVLKLSNLATLLPHALNDFELTQESVDDLTTTLNFSISENIGFALALTDFERLDAKTTGRNLLLAQIEQLCANTGQILSSELIHSVLSFLRKSEDLSMHLDSFLQFLSSAQPRDDFSFALTPMLAQQVHEAPVFRSMDFHTDSADNDLDAILAEIDKEVSVGDLMGELGCGFTADAQQCKEILSSFAPLGEATISRIVGNVSRTCADLEDNQTTFSTFTVALGSCIPTELPTPRSWNVDILVDTIKQLTAYNLIQREVVSAILPVIITSPQDSGFIHNLWHQNAELVLWGIIDAQHLKADSMLRIIEICHELKVLKAHDNAITSSQLVEEIEKVNAAILDCNPKLQNGEAKDSSAPNAYGDDVEAEANAYFHQMFSSHLSVDAMVQMLSRYKESLVPREKLIFECMIANLFEEYRFFPKYPERQLKIASILFDLYCCRDILLNLLRLIQISGSVIKHQLISSLTLGMALRLVLDSLRKPADSKMFLFGSKALEQFVNRLVELPQYCNHILQISHLRSTHPELVTVIEQALSRISSGNLESDASVSHPGPSQSFPGNGELSGSGIGQPALQLSSPLQLQQKNEVPSVPSNEAKPLLPSLSTTSVDVSVNPKAPPSDVQDKVSFIINNISTTNIESKGKEFAEILPQQYYPWFAQYMVMKRAMCLIPDRASIEPNFHDLYLKFLDKVDSKLLFKEILQNTYENCKVLLGSELIKSSSEERSLLKNLGSWLGRLTIGRNYVLRAREIDPKSLIVLFKNLGVEMKEVVPTSLLKDRKREIDGNPDFSNKDPGVTQISQPQMIPEPKTISPLKQIDLPLDVANSPNTDVPSKLLSQYVAPQRVYTNTLMDEEKVATLGLPEQLPSPQGLFQSTPSPLFSISQEPLRTSISGHLRNSLQGLNISNDALEQIVQLVTNDNLDLGCAAIEQAATEKAIQTIDADIAQQLLLRRKHRDGAGSSFFDPNILSQNSVSFIPESLRPKPGHLSLSQQRVYEDFVQHPWQKQSTQTSHGLSAASSSSGDVALGSGYGPVSGKVASEFLSNAGNARMDMVSRPSDISVDGFESSPVSLLSSQVDPAGDSSSLQFTKSLPTSELNLAESSDAATKETGTSLQTLTSAATMERLGASNITQPSLSTRDALDKCQIVTQKAVISEVPEIILRCISRDEAAFAVAQKAFKALYENASSNLHVSANLAILVAIRDVCKRVVKELTSWVCLQPFQDFTSLMCFEDRKLNKDITIGLIQRELLSLAEYNVHMAKHLDGGRNSMLNCLTFVDVLRPQLTLLFLYSNPWSLRSRVSFQSSTVLLMRWQRLRATPLTQKRVPAWIMWNQILRVSRIGCPRYLKTGIKSANFLVQMKPHVHNMSCICTRLDYLREMIQQRELSVAHCISSEDINSGAVQSPQQPQSPSFLIIDMFSQLLPTPSTHCSLLRFLLSELVSHRSFMPKLLTVNGQKGWPYVQRLLVDLLQFLEPFLRNAELGGPVHFLYKGTLRVLLVLLHDFPEFLCDYHFTFCDVIPSSCIQMRNIILSSFPRNMRLPDPSTPNLKIDLLPEIVEAPCILSEVDAALKAKQMKNDVDEYLTSRQQNSTFLSELKTKLLLSSSEASSAGTRYSVPLINSLVLYTGMQAIQQLQAGETQAQNVVALQMFKYLSMELDTEGRYLFLNAIANQLRYPNNHTHYFSFIMLYLFFESDQEIIQEQITRVLLERLIVNRPHPWGLLITFIELIKNPRYSFWKQAFIRCAPEIEKLFESVARSCGGLKPVDEGMVSGGWVSDNSH
ncbi:Similar to yeast general negative regulator of transcription subunit 1 [Arabidopsis thaliana]|uniref:T7I23.15 protein n=1 Tax=Arabidopsis thaliana TaxID=3702 RepID=O81909_ARATH|nr:Similar to yeast general negative regulator of transcription subunit 1 [Arabidopsis thaliana]